MRITITVFCLLFAIALSGFGAPVPLRGRDVLSLDGTWQAKIDPSDSGMKAGWFKTPPGPGESVIVPISEKAPAPSAATVWYWREFEIPATWHQNNQRLKFHGVGGRADYWLNGKEIGHSELLYTPTTFDVTKGLRTDKPNLLAVRVTDLIGARKTPMGYRPHGLWQKVELIAADEAHIRDVFVDAKTNGWTNVRVDIMNVSDKTGDAQLEVEVAERANPKKKVGSTYQTVRISPGANRADLLFHVKSPSLWTPGTPILYTATVKLRQGKDLLDNAAQTFGYRQFVMESGQPKLNGERITLKMMPNLPPDSGKPTPLEALENAKRAAAEARQAGTLVLWVVPSPLPSSILDAADEAGLLVYEEPESSAVAAAEALVRRDRNHPAIVAWGLAGDGQASAESVTARIAELDATRPVLAAPPVSKEQGVGHTAPVRRVSILPAISMSR